MQNLQYPIGPFKFTSQQQPSQWIESLVSLPERVKNLVHDFTESDWDIPYRPHGWNGRQLIHHLADSHMNSFIRFKLALTEDAPTIRPYYEDRWAQLADVNTVAPEISLQILTGLHLRWVTLIQSMTKEDFNKKFYHPGDKKWVTLIENTAFYAWHSDHHFAHLQQIDVNRKNK